MAEKLSDEIVRELCGDEINGGFIRDLCFTVWSICHNPKHEDGNSDWGNDTLPTVQEGVSRIRAMLSGASPSTSTGESDWVLVPREPAVNMRHVGGEVVEERQGHSTPRDLAAAVYREMVMAASLHTPRAMLASAPAPDTKQEPVAVKPLEWASVTDQIPKHAFAAYTPFTRWLIVCEFLSMNHMVYRFNGADYETLDEAKAAAQADYEARIRSALFPSPVTQKVSEAWQPIETAPKDGTRILATCASAQAPRASVTWWEGKWLIQIVPDQFVSGDPRQWFPTHWQPLPAPPLQAQEKSE